MKPSHINVGVYAQKNAYGALIISTNEAGKKLLGAKAGEAVAVGVSREGADVTVWVYFNPEDAPASTPVYHWNEHGGAKYKTHMRVQAAVGRTLLRHVNRTRGVRAVRVTPNPAGFSFVLPLDMVDSCGAPVEPALPLEPNTPTPSVDSDERPLEQRSVVAQPRTADAAVRDFLSWDAAHQRACMIEFLKGRGVRTARLTDDGRLVSETIL